MRTILPIIAALALACSDAVVDYAAEQSQAVCGSTCLVSATDQTVTAPTLPPASTHLCAPTRFKCSGGHSAGPILAWGIPAYGGSLGGSNDSVFAFPNTNGSGWTSPGSCTASVQCDEWSKFHGTGGNVAGGAQLGPWTHTSGPPVWVSGVQTVVWGWDVACYISNVWGLGIVTEKVETATNANGWNWDLRASGYKSLGAGMKCSWLGRGVSAWQLITATPGNPAFSGMSASAGRCFIVDIEGNLDDGEVKLTGNPIVLYAFGGVTKAQAQCTLY